MQSPRLPVKKNRAKKKGNEGEREVAKVFNEEFALRSVDLLARRILTETREGSYDVEIVWGIGSPEDERDVRRDRSREPVLDYTIQVKNVTSRYGSYLYKAWLEARAYSDDRVPIGCVKVPSKKGWKKRDQWLAVLPLECLAELLANFHSTDPLWVKGD